MPQIRGREFKWESLDDVRDTFNQLIQASSAACDRLKENRPRNDETLVPFNFLACSVTYSEIVRNTIPSPIQLLALCTRSVYELSLRAKKVLSDPQELKKWIDETAYDNVYVLESYYDGFLASDPLGAEVRQQIDQFKQMLISKGLNSPVRPPPTAELAREFGLETKHRAMFGLFSKLVHPSAFLLNGWQYNKDPNMANTLILCLIDYSDHLLRFVASHMGIPEGVIKW